MFAFLAGLAAGGFHVVAGPDHLAAVAPLAADTTRTAWRSGFTWGVGHMAGVLVVGALLLALREVIPVDLLSAASERLVGVALVGVGTWGVWQARRLHVHRHAEGAAHAHVGAPVTAMSSDVEHGHQHASLWFHGHARSGASFGMGLLHGVAGSSHLFGVLPALAFSSRTDSAVYLAGFGIGAVSAMSAFAAAVGALAAHPGRSRVAVRSAVLYVTSVAAVVVGGVWLLA